MAKSVSFYPDDDPARFVYMGDSGDKREYEYRKVMGIIEGGDGIIEPIYIPVDADAKEPPRKVLDKMEEHDLEVHPESMVEVTQELAP